MYNTLILLAVLLATIYIIVKLANKEYTRYISGLERNFLDLNLDACTVLRTKESGGLLNITIKHNCKMYVVELVKINSPTNYFFHSITFYDLELDENTFDAVYVQKETKLINKEDLLEYQQKFVNLINI